MRALGLIALLLLAGCVGADRDAASTPDVTEVAPFAPGEETSRSVEAPPVHPVGRAWTFTGIQEYNPDTEIVVVVAEASESGYLFAGAAEDDVHYDALWGNPLFGPHERSMLREGYLAHLQFPLHDGKTWDYAEGFPLTARAATVRTPSGDEPGFMIEGAGEWRTLKVEYAPSLGQIVSYWSQNPAGRVLDDFRLTRMEEGRAWTWYERGDITAVWNPHEPAAFEVPAGYDAFLISASGVSGSRANVRSASNDAWSAEFPAAQDVWQHATLPATPGRWTAAVAARPFIDDAPDVDVPYPVGWAHVQMAPVKWLRSAG